MLGKGSSPEHDGHGTGSPGHWSWSQVLEFRVHLDNTFRCTVWILGGPAWSWKLDSMVLEGIFQLSIYYDSMILSCNVDRRGQTAWEHEVRVSGSRMEDLRFFILLS